MREELVASAVNLLQQPQVAAAPLEKRIAFLQSKNLTSDEINAALQRVGEPPVAPTAVVPAGGAYGAPPPTSAGYGPYFGGGQMMQRPNESPAARDWRDWFVMATVTGGVGYGLYHLAKRYVYPVIAPPTPPQLEQDKAAIDASFATAFTLLDQLSKDTEALKAAEEARTARVDTALEEVESVIEQLKATAKRREDEGKRVADEVRSLRDLIPKALDGQKDAQSAALQDLQSELKSLKALVVNRTAAAAAPAPRYPGQGLSGPVGTPPLDPGAAQNGLGKMGGMGAGGGSSASPLPFGLPQGNKSAIPAWQLGMKSGTAQDGGEGPSGSS